MSDDLPIDEIRRAAPSRKELRAVFSRHSGPADEWPPSYGRARRLAETLVDDGRPEAAASILLSALEDLRRFFAEEDDDTDFGWQRGEKKYWQRWATMKTLRSLLVDTPVDVSWRVDVLRAIRQINVDTDEGLDGWLHLPELSPLSPTDDAVLRGEEPPPDEPDWTPREEVIASRLRDEARRDVAGARQMTRREVAPPPTDEDVDRLDRLYRFRRVAERLLASGEADLAAGAALAGLTYADDEVAPRAMDRSGEAVGAADEQSRGLERVLEDLVAVGGSELRRAILEEAEGNPDVLARLRRLFGRGDDAETVREAERLVERFERTEEGDERRKLARQLVFQFGDVLSDERFLDFCAEFEWTESRVNRLLSIGRVDEAFTVARGAVDEIVDGRPPSELADIVRGFLDAAHPGRAARLVEPIADETPELAELRARSLLEAKSSQAPQAFLSWFKMRPTIETYRAVDEALSGETWLETDERIRTYLRDANLEHVLVDVAVADEDIETLDELITTLDGVALEHARGRVGDLKSSLSRDARDQLER